jgi:hypothetical protein
MQDLPYLNEIVAHAKDKVMLITLNSKQINDSVDFFLKKLLITNDTNIILVSFLQPAQKVFEKFPTNKLFIVDCSENGKPIDNAIIVRETNNITQIQIAIEKAFEKIGGKGIVIFDSLNILSIYNSGKEIERFIYFFTNKMKLTDNSCIYLITQNSTEKEIIEMAKQFCDKTFDFSKLYVSIETK